MDNGIIGAGKKLIIGGVLCMYLSACLLGTGCGQKISADNDQQPIEGSVAEESISDDLPAEDEQQTVSEDPSKEPVEPQLALPRLRDIRNEFREFQHSSAWDQYEENDTITFSHDFIQSSNQYVNNMIKFSLNDMLYAYEQQVHQNLLSGNWTIERITLIGGDYYQVQICQDDSGARIGCLISPAEQNYKILYAFCKDGDRTTEPDGVSHYFSQAEWHGYSWEYSSEDADAIEARLYNPFSEVFLTSTHTTLCAALLSYQDLSADTRVWEVADIYEYGSLVNYYLVSDDCAAWLSADMINQEYAIETFYVVENNDSAQDAVQSEYTEELSYPYDYLDVDDPRAQEIMAEGWEDGFITSIPIRGLVGYSPISNNWGGLASYHKDREVLIEKNVGKGIFQSDKLAVVKENMAEMFMDIIRNRGSNIEDYQKFFSDRGMLEQFKDFLINDIRKEWILLESHYLSDYAGNNDSFWWDGLNSETLRYVETESFYNFKFMFYADYRAMECGEDDEASAIWIGCGISKETGLIEELATGQWSLSRNDFEISRW